jgi:uncharacterized protein (TIGR00725 family)
VDTSWSPAEDGADGFVVGVLGSARLGDDDARYHLATQVGAALAREDWAVMTGGYGGLMAAAASGAAGEGGHVIGLPMRAWGGLTPSTHVAELRWCDTYQERLGHLLSCDAVIGLDGGIGTLAELTGVWAAAQTEAAALVVVTVGPAWRAILAVVAECMVVGEEDLRLVTSVDDAAEVVTAVRSGLAAHRVATPRG